MLYRPLPRWRRRQPPARIFESSTSVIMIAAAGAALLIIALRDDQPFAAFEIAFFAILIALIIGGIWRMLRRT